MSTIAGIINAISGMKRSKLTCLDTSILDAVEKTLPSEKAIQFAKQRQATTLVQREPGGLAINLYRTRKKLTEHIGAKPMYDLPLDYLGARVTFLQNKQTFKASIWFVKGWLFSIEYNKRPYPADHTEWKIDSIEHFIDRESISRRIENVAHKRESVNFSDEWQKWLERHADVELTEPLSQKRRNNALDALGIRLPKDYIELIGKSDGAKGKAFKIHGIEHLHTVDISGSPCIVLADMLSQCAICVSREDAGKCLRSYKFDDESIERLPFSIRAAIDKIIGP